MKIAKESLESRTVNKNGKLFISYRIKQEIDIERGGGCFLQKNEITMAWQIKHNQIFRSHENGRGESYVAVFIDKGYSNLTGIPH